MYEILCGTGEISLIFFKWRGGGFGDSLQNLSPEAGCTNTLVKKITELTRSKNENYNSLDMLAVILTICVQCFGAEVIQVIVMVAEKVTKGVFFQFARSFALRAFFKIA